MCELYYPLRSLREGHWFKLICGASYQHLPAVRNLTLAYTLAGADCIDVAADPAVIAAARDGMHIADALAGEAKERRFGLGARPWLMVSLNDGEDPHFRKAEFDPEFCPADCHRPCEKVCPAQAIVFENASHLRGKTAGFSGVIDERCYGCGRCLPVCPSQLIYTRSYVSAPDAVAKLVLPSGVDALEIHTQVGHYDDFLRLWRAIVPWIDKLKLLAISCPDGEGLLDYLRSLYAAIAPLPCPLVWQTDGRPMSGDIGTGTTRAAVKLSEKVLAAGLPGYVQLAGGTNDRTVAKLKAAGLLNPRNGDGQETQRQRRSPATKSLYSTPMPPAAYVAGVAYGSYARALLSPVLDQLDAIEEQNHGKLAPLSGLSQGHLEAFPPLLWQAVTRAHGLVSQLKLSQKLPQAIPH